MWVGVSLCVMLWVTSFQAEQTEFTQDSNVSYNSDNVSTSHEVESSSAGYDVLIPVDDDNTPPQYADGHHSIPLDNASTPKPNLTEQDTSSAEEVLFLYEAKQAKAVGRPVGEISSPEFWSKRLNSKHRSRQICSPSNSRTASKAVR